jgi:hypothetical protein
MEDPSHWDRLTAALYQAGGPAEERWAFLRLLDLVLHRGPQDPARFSRIVRTVEARQHGAGPSSAYQIAVELKAAGLTTAAAHEPDPYGEAAERAWQRWRERRLRRRLLSRWLHPLHRPRRFAADLGQRGFEARSVRHELEAGVEHGPVRGTGRCLGDTGVVALLSDHRLGWVVPAQASCAGWFKGDWIMAWSLNGDQLSIEYWLPPDAGQLDGPFQIKVAGEGRQYLWVTADPADLDEFVARASRVLPERAADQLPERRRGGGGVQPLPEGHPEG